MSNSCKFAPARKYKPLKFNRRNMLKFANEIYNEKTGEYTRLCNGTLTNGRDPDDKMRVLHCGLGELEFRFNGAHAYNQFSTTHKPPSVETIFRDENDIVRHFSYLPEVCDPSEASSLLESIPQTNDNAKSYKTRARRVAAKLREFAALIVDSK